MTPTTAPGLSPTADTWNLDDLYPDEATFLDARERVKQVVPGLPRFSGRLAEGAALLVEAFAAIEAVSKDLLRLHAFASMRSDADTRVASFQAARGEIELLWNEFAKSIAWLRPEILALPDGTIARYVGEEPRLAEHRHYLEDLLRSREHVLSPPEERLLAEAGLVVGGAANVFNVFSNAEMPRPEVTLADGTVVRLTSANFMKHRVTSPRPEREMLAATYFEAYTSFRETLGTNLHEQVKAHVFRARTRKFGSCLAAALHGDNVPESVYRNLIGQVRRNLPVLHRYMGLRARALGLDRVGYHDLHCPLTTSRGPSWDVGSARDAVRASLEPMGPAYVQALDRGFHGRWIDWHATPGKRSGAYSSGSAYDVHPYILLNWNGDHDAVSTLTHELGHAMHSWFSNRAQPFATADYSIFVAEVASTFNEALLQAHLVREAATDEDRLFLLGTWLDHVRATLFRQTMFAEFELAIHERAERGEALTGEGLSADYLALLRSYQGHDHGVMVIPQRYDIEWAVVPHFYYNFYVYQYATGIIASTALSGAVLAGDHSARDRYLAFLSAGGSDYPLEILRRAGVDLERPEPYDAAFAEIGRTLDELDAVLRRLGR